MYAFVSDLKSVSEMKIASRRKSGSHWQFETATVKVLQSAKTTVSPCRSAFENRSVYVSESALQTGLQYQSGLAFGIDLATAFGCRIAIGR